MAKILKIDHETNIVIIGMDDYSTIEIPKTDIPFEIMEMMIIDVHEHEGRYLCSLRSSSVRTHDKPHSLLQKSAVVEEKQEQKIVEQRKNMPVVLSIDDNMVSIRMMNSETIQVEKSQINFEVIEGMSIGVHIYDDEYLFTLPPMTAVEKQELAIAEQKKNMPSVLSIDDNMVTIRMVYGEIIQVEKSTINFEVTEGMSIGVHTYDGEYLFTLPPAINLSTDKTYVDKAVYLLLFFFFGSLGIHEFFAGHVQKGVAWLLATLLVWGLLFVNFINQASYWVATDAYDPLGIYSAYHHSHGVFYYISVGLFIIYSIFIFIILISILCKSSNDKGQIPISNWGFSSN